MLKNMLESIAEGSENDISWMSPQQQQEYKSAKSAAQSHPEIWKQYQHYSIQDLKKEFPNQPDQELKYLLNVIQHGLDSYDPNHLLGQGRTIRTILQWKEQGVAEGTGNDFRVGQRVIYTTGRGEKFPSIVTAIDFDEDAVKIKSANNKPFPNSGGDIEIVVDPGWKFLTPEPRVDPDSVIAVSPSMRKTTERVRDPEDWDEGNTEPPNNFAVYVNGKKIAVFQGRGRYADDDREQAHHEQLKGWARKKSAETGKKWEVSITGEPATR
jgi:hypothetical protein